MVRCRHYEKPSMLLTHGRLVSLPSLVVRVYAFYS